LDETKRASVRNERFLCKNYRPFLEGIHFDLFAKILFNPIDIFLAKLRQSFLQKLFMFLGNFKGVQELSDSLQPGKDGIFPAEGILSEEDLESGLILMLAILEVGVGAGELIKVIEE
jgi:hypothetical protein